MKRGVDLLLVALSAPVWAPLALAAALGVRMRLGAPVLFTQLRPGLNGKPFALVKFRTMREGVGSNGITLTDEERLTPFGKWLRATSLDELPELWNVVRGDMSLVGPRPLLMDYLDLYSPEQARRHEVRPGITGWAQVNGRNALSWEERFALDVWYVDNRGLLLDLRIMALTIARVLRRDGISAAGEATMSKFKGTTR
jgi:lipopolysaccharide/colanic/teichoic acid biosynthesis glycosyltransferase